MTEPFSNSCPNCGRTIPAGDACTACVNTKVQVWQMVLLVLLAVGAAGLYFGVHAFAASSHAIRINDAAYWYNEGERQLGQQHAGAAVTAFRKACLIEQNRVYARALAQALVADGREAQAHELLLQERQTTPEDPEINVDLGRLAAKENDIPETIRYYHNALYGAWTGP